MSIGMNSHRVAAPRLQPALAMKTAGSRASAESFRDATARAAMGAADDSVPQGEGAKVRPRERNESDVFTIVPWSGSAKRLDERDDGPPILFGVLTREDHAFPFQQLLVRASSRAVLTAALSPRLLEPQAGLFIALHGAPEPNGSRFDLIAKPRLDRSNSWPLHRGIGRLINQNSIGDQVIKYSKYSFLNNDKKVHFMSTSVKAQFVAETIAKNLGGAKKIQSLSYLALFVCYGSSYADQIAQTTGQKIIAFSGPVNITAHAATATLSGPDLQIHHPEGHRQTVAGWDNSKNYSLNETDALIRRSLSQNDRVRASR